MMDKYALMNNFWFRSRYTMATVRFICFVGIAVAVAVAVAVTVAVAVDVPMAVAVAVAVAVVVFVVVVVGMFIATMAVRNTECVECVVSFKAVIGICWTKDAKLWVSVIRVFLLGSMSFTGTTSGYVRNFNRSMLRYYRRFGW